jgi:archaellum component FlaC
MNNYHSIQHKPSKPSQKFRNECSRHRSFREFMPYRKDQLEDHINHLKTDILYIQDTIREYENELDEIKSIIKLFIRDPPLVQDSGCNVHHPLSQ